MLLRKLWPAVVDHFVVGSVFGCDRRSVLRVSSSQVPLSAHERQVWTSAIRDPASQLFPHTTARTGCEAAQAPEPLATPNPLLDTPDFNSKISVSFIIGTDGRVP